MANLVQRQDPFNPNPIQGTSSEGTVQRVGLDKPGVVGIDLLGGGTGIVGGATKNAVGLLGEVINTPLEIVTGEIAESRLERSLVTGDSAVDPKYIRMVTEQGLSVSDVADQMANDGVAVTGGVAHDLLIGVFLDPFNLISAGIGKGYDTAKRSASIQERLTDSGAKTISDSAARSGATKSEVEWLNGGVGRKFLGEAYTSSSRRLGGIKKGMAQAMFGRGAGIAAVAIGINTLSKIIGIAETFGKSDAVLRAAGIGANNLTLSAASDLVVRRAFAESRATAMAKAKIFAKSSGVNDENTFQEFVRATGFSPDTADFTLPEIRKEWEDLHAEIGVKDPAAKEQQASAAILRRDTAGMINEEIGQRGTLGVLNAQRAMDETGIRRQVLAQKDVYVSENLFTLAAGATDAERVALAADEFIQNLSPFIGESAAKAAWNAIESEARNSVSSQELLRKLAEGMYSSQVLRLGFVADSFAAAKRGLLERITGVSRARVLAALPENTRTLLINQADRFSIAAKDTMTDVDYNDLLKILQDEKLPAAERAQAAMKAVYQFSNLRKMYDARSFQKLVSSNPEGAVKALLNTLSEYSADSFVKQVPLAPFKSAERVIPEVKELTRIVERGQYKIVFEPLTAATKPNRIYADLVTKDTARFGVDLWAPISDNVMDVSLGNRNMVGNVIDFLTGERLTSQVVANTLSRMQEFAVSKNIPLSRKQIIAIHRALTDYSFKTKGSIRTAMDDELSGGSVGILSKVINETAQTSPEAAMQLDQMMKDGTLRKLVFWAAEGDLGKVGIQAKFTGRLKALSTIGRVATYIADDLYPKAKFRYSPLFGMQEVVESKWWNLMRGYSDEWKVTLPGGEVRFGNKRFYDITGPDGKVYKLDALEVISEAMISDRVELKYAQEMAAVNRYFSGSVTDAIIAFGGDNEGFIKALKNGFKGDPGSSKNLDYLKFVSAEGLDDLAEELSTRMSQVAPRQYETWLMMAGGNKKGAALLFLKERQQLIRSRSTARAYWESQKHYGIGFGRQYDDTPVKNLDRLRKDSASAIADPLADKRTSRLKKVGSALSLIHADAAAIGYSKETLGAIQEAQRALDDATDVALTASNRISKRGQAAIDEAISKMDEARFAMRKEFEAAVARKKMVKDVLISSGISKPLATEMAALFVVAERRSEMLPQVSTAISRAMSGGSMSPAAVDTMKDHLMKIRMARTEEETLYNAVGYGLENAMSNADRTHYFTTNRGFLEKSINHPVFGLYPTSYMFGKVLPEYARMLFMSPTKSVAGAVLAPYMAIVKGVSFGKFSPEDWGRYAPLVGFSAMLKIRQAYVEGENMSDNGERNPLIYFLVNTMIPGLPTEISASPSAPVRRIIQQASEGKGPTWGDIGYSTSQLAASTLGVGRLAGQTSDILEQLTSPSKDADLGGGTGGLLGTAGEMIGSMAESIGDILLNK